jgi:hypothetical protein
VLTPAQERDLRRREAAAASGPYRARALFDQAKDRAGWDAARIQRTAEAARCLIRELSTNGRALARAQLDQLVLGAGGELSAGDPAAGRMAVTYKPPRRSRRLAPKATLAYKVNHLAGLMQKAKGTAQEQQVLRLMCDLQDAERAAVTSRAERRTRVRAEARLAIAALELKNDFVAHDLPSCLETAVFPAHMARAAVVGRLDYLVQISSDKVGRLHFRPSLLHPLPVAYPL